ncbi:uncharacterized protein I303_104309 [Kwoniella dejecticola CBS 10117]|uniref:Transcriptional coactivator p15 (PC4) C-terminal domain-containing protein n=1 Tax=Kwoniella dejecticola CBS 10117 TaxID=1296121 RepID=A0A1A6A5P7_9TREE|nr:uncharacterized protein I303_04717 [Kwoniella dejecticola CBS 10117]OBR85382.1 hypothetical protein I303_04717 [Kwoniella dejecticola CBS 10117]
MSAKQVRALSSSDDEDLDDKPETSKSSKAVPSSKRGKDADGGSEPQNKKSRPSTAAESDGQVVIEENDEGDQFFKLSEQRRLTVRQFKGKVLVDIRETYKDKNTGQVKPGNKGIALSKEQWDLIKNNINNVDDMIVKVNEK